MTKKKKINYKQYLRKIKYNLIVMKDIKVKINHNK